MQQGSSGHEETPHGHVNVEVNSGGTAQHEHTTTHNPSSEPADNHATAARSGGSSSGPVDVTTDVNVAGSSHPHSGTQGGGKSSSGPVNVDASVNVAGSSHPHSGTQGGGGSSSGPVNVDASVNVPGYVDASGLGDDSWLNIQWPKADFLTVSPNSQTATNAAAPGGWGLTPWYLS
ncbi:g4811 [Coccomyxa viridis]|uniref:G4811 protein n=1 Tax=Coccomyxa viridis TaxID=1274662 RepID=A0ABP1FSN8_9CHLO